MSEAEANYMRRLNTAALQGKPLAEVEEKQARKIALEINKRVQVPAARDILEALSFLKLRRSNDEYFKLPLTAIRSFYAHSVVCLSE